MWERLCQFRSFDHEKAGSLVAGKLLLSCVGEHVTVQVTWCIKALSHLMQLNAFSPVWERSCFFRSPDVMKALSHWMQGNGFSPMWEIFCLFRLPERRPYCTGFRETHLASVIWHLTQGKCGHIGCRKTVFLLCGLPANLELPMNTSVTVQVQLDWFIGLFWTA